jgi:integrase
MPWLEQTPSGVYHIAFRFDGQKFKKSLRTTDRHTANARLHRVDENARLLESGRLVVPDGADLATFLLSDGQLNRANSRPRKRQIRTLRDFTEIFFSAIPDAALEDSTLNGMRTHVGHLRRVLGASFLLLDVGLDDLQRYVDRRSKDKGLRGKRLSPATIKKEQQDELWSSLFLTTGEIQELLEHVRVTARNPFLYPMFVFAAHTGARRSEILRSEIDDIDFAGANVIIREKKRVRRRLTTRSVPLSPLLRKILREWIPVHPGGAFTFSLGLDVKHSKKPREESAAITRDEAHDHFK